MEDPLGSTPFLNSRSAPSGLRVPCAWHSGNHVSLSNAAHTETCEEERERESERERKRERDKNTETKTQRERESEQNKNEKGEGGRQRDREIDGWISR